MTTAGRVKCDVCHFWIDRLEADRELDGCPDARCHCFEQVGLVGLAIRRDERGRRVPCGCGKPYGGSAWALDGKSGVLLCDACASRPDAVALSQLKAPFHPPLMFRTTL